MKQKSRINIIKLCLIFILLFNKSHSQTFVKLSLQKKDTSFIFSKDMAFNGKKNTNMTISLQDSTVVFKLKVKNYSCTFKANKSFFTGDSAFVKVNYNVFNKYCVYSIKSGSRAIAGKEILK